MRCRLTLVAAGAPAAPDVAQRHRRALCADANAAMGYGTARVRPATNRGLTSLSKDRQQNGASADCPPISLSFETKPDAPDARPATPEEARPGSPIAGEFSCDTERRSRKAKPSGVSTACETLGLPPLDAMIPVPETLTGALK